ncbi:MAG: endonuclease/exonuclease/phosphatase family protein, partial [Betaproteobacteria bacterium]|nr:endonuclease/exonuclease/phosphatase family protein [Betaproteobacteria bacterium]
MKLATWNVNSLSVRLPQLTAWLSAQQPDALVLQETKLTDDRFPVDALRAAGYHSVFFGQKTYNGVALLTRDSLGEPQAVVHGIPNYADAQARVIAGTVGALRVVGAYFPNG